MLRLSGHWGATGPGRHAVTHWTGPPGTDPDPMLLMTEAPWLLDEPTLDELNVPLAFSWPASTTLILPPNSNSFVLTWLLFLTH